jgi:hypothetical protein
LLFVSLYLDVLKLTKLTKMSMYTLIKLLVGFGRVEARIRM